MRLRPIVAVLVLLVTPACTRGDTSTASTETASPTRSSSALPTTVATMDITFDVRCVPVAEALVDIDLPHAAGEPKLRAITGVWDHQGIAVLANDPQGCGVWALGLAEGLSHEASDTISAEVARGVEHFGVTASPVPREP